MPVGVPCPVRIGARLPGELGCMKAESHLKSKLDFLKREKEHPATGGRMRARVPSAGNAQVLKGAGLGSRGAGFASQLLGPRGAEVRRESEVDEVGEELVERALPAGEDRA